MKTAVLATVAIVLAAPCAFAKTDNVSLQDKRQAACYDDVQKLCADALPDVDKVTACMAPKRAQVSAKCAAIWDAKE